jgi:serine/threonine-protein kinase
VLTALWSLFLWAELVASRAGAVPFCPLGEAAECSALWDGGFSRAVHSWTGLPIAAWGMVWGLAAAALPLFALQRFAEGGSASALVSAARVMAVGGVAAVLVFGGVAAGAGSFCAGCFATYVVVAGYAGIALFGWQHLGWPERSRGFANAAGATAAFFLLLLAPGMKTPKSAAEVGRAALAGSSPALAEFLGTLAPGLKQTLSDSLFIHKNGIALTPGPARSLHGESSAPLRITEFTDVLCDHCAQLHETLLQLRETAPAGSFSVESRQFPLDAECNAAVQRREGPLRCLAAKAQICLEGHEKAFDYAGALFAKQKTLTTADVYSLAAPYLKKPELDACIASPETNAKLQDDIQLALRYELDGTPLVLLNGKKAVAFPPFLYALVLANGATEHPAFASLPAPNPNAHVH